MFHDRGLIIEELHISLSSIICLSICKYLSVHPSLYHPSIYVYHPFVYLSRLSVHLCCFQSLSHVQLCDPMDCSTPGFPVLHHLLDFAQTHVH